jgi:hypothetical protein
MAKQNLYQRVDEAIERGETWRAKEMLRGNVGSGSYDSQLYERYGKLLLDLGELVEAGKYLFLSGRRHPEYDEAIAVYLSRHPESRPELLFRSFPSGARFRELHRYPLEVRRVLEERGLPQHFADVDRERTERWRRRRAEDPDNRSFGLITPVPGTGGWAGYAPLRHRLASTPAQVGLRVLLQGVVGAVVLFLGASTVVGLAVIVRWLVSLT